MARVSHHAEPTGGAGYAARQSFSLPQGRTFAIWLMVISSVMISFGGVIVRNIEFAGPWQINVYRSLALVVAISLLLFLQYRSRTIEQICKIGYPGVWAGATISIAGIAFLQALDNTTVASTMFTLSSIPFITALFAFVFLRERLTLVTLVAMLAAAAGICIMFFDSGGTASLFGNLMALVTAVGFSAFAVIVRAYRHIDMLPALLVSALLIAVVASIASIHELGISLHDLLLCILWGGVLSGLGNGMFIIASRHLVAAELTLFMLLEFSLSPFWVWLFVNEAPGRWALAGGVIVISAVTIRSLLEMETSRPLRRGRPSPG